MAEKPSNPVKDKKYDLITVLQESPQNAWTMETYIKDAEQRGDEELAKWFRKIQRNNQKAGEQGKEMLQKRLEAESS
ncbi:hypothetical protein AB0I53_24620 [Saccharopolyspora sp. NPDC050389]|uniref:hypothetical protein n=1 Tax=Saccharopolyspora TaxID=1835 RepID=UPI003409C24D